MGSQVYVTFLQTEQNHVPWLVTRVPCVLWSVEKPPGACMEKVCAGNDFAAEVKKQHFLFLFSSFGIPLNFGAAQLGLSSY